MADPQVVNRRPYQESESHVPNPTDMYGEMKTAGTTGDDHNYSASSPVFDIARKRDLAVAKRALDPEDPSVHESLVTLPQGATIVHADPDEARERVLAKADEGPVEVGAPTASQEAAAEEGIPVVPGQVGPLGEPTSADAVRVEQERNAAEGGGSPTVEGTGPAEGESTGPAMVAPPEGTEGTDAAPQGRGRGTVQS